MGILTGPLEDIVVNKRLIHSVVVVLMNLKVMFITLVCIIDTVEVSLS